MSLAEIKRRLQPGTAWDVTNVTVRPDSPVFGTHRRTVTRTRARGFSLSIPGQEQHHPEGSSVAWPKASQASIGEDGVIRIYSGPPGPASLFLTLVPASTSAGT